MTCKCLSRRSDFSQSTKLFLSLPSSVHKPSIITSLRSLLVSPPAHLCGRCVDGPASGRCCVTEGSALTQGHSWMVRRANLIHLHFIAPVRTLKWPRSCSSLKLIASIPFPRTQVHLSSLSAGYKSSPASIGQTCKTKLVFKASSWDRCSSEWYQMSCGTPAVMSWTLQTIHQAFTSQDTALCRWVYCTVCRTGVRCCWAAKTVAEQSVCCLYPVQKAQQLLPTLTMTLPGKQNMLVDHTEKDTPGIMHFSMFLYEYLGRVRPLLFIHERK